MVVCIKYWINTENFGFYKQSAAKQVPACKASLTMAILYFALLFLYVDHKTDWHAGQIHTFVLTFASPCHLTTFHDSASILWESGVYTGNIFGPNLCASLSILST